jgi:predicted methyltransferase
MGDGMKRMMLRAALASALLLAVAPAAVVAQQAPAADPALKAAEIVAFIGLKPGNHIADVIPGKLMPAFSQAVGPNGKVYAVETAEVAAKYPAAWKNLQALAAQPGFANVEISAKPVNDPLPGGLDAVFIRQNYHDLYDKFMGPADVPAFNKHVYAALKPGGVYVVLDHAGPVGSDLRDVETLHRIAPERVKADILAAGFKLEAESAILANPADDHSKNVFAPEVRGKTDQFLFKFRKPR